MFKVIGYFDEWEDLYVSRQASRELISYRGKDGMHNGRDGDFEITELGYSRSGSQERPRLIQLFTEANHPWAGFLIGHYLRSRAASEIEVMLRGGERTALSGEISSMFRVCEEVDSKLVPQLLEKRSPAKQGSSVGQEWKLSAASVGIALIALLGTILLSLKISNLRTNHQKELTSFSGLTETNHVLRTSNGSLLKEIRQLAGEKEGLTADAKKLRQDIVEMEEKLQRMRREEQALWLELAEKHTLGVLQLHEKSVSMRQIIQDVQRVIPLSGTIIEETVAQLVKKGRVGTEGFGFAPDYYLKKQ